MKPVSMPIVFLMTLQISHENVSFLPQIDSLTENPLQPVSVQNPPVEVLVNASNVCGLQNPQPPSFKKVAGFRPGSDLDVLGELSA